MVESLLGDSCRNGNTHYAGTLKIWNCNLHIFGTFKNNILCHYFMIVEIQTWKMTEILPKRDCLFPHFTRKCVYYVNFKIATKQRN